ncbi:MAG: hypothetical protein Q7R83_00875 [bacterium]|nr:hypothetical protein [bacterium]
MLAVSCYPPPSVEQNERTSAQKNRKEEALMLVTRSEVLGMVREFLVESDRRHLDRIVDLSMLAYIIREFAFQCPMDWLDTLKPVFMSAVRGGANNVFIEGSWPCQFTQDALPQLDDLTAAVELCRMFDDAARRGPDPSVVEAECKSFATWLDDAWATGVRQQRVYRCEIEGSIVNREGAIQNFAAGIAIFGQRNGLLPKQE